MSVSQPQVDHARKPTSARQVNLSDSTEARASMVGWWRMSQNVSWIGSRQRWTCWRGHASRFQIRPPYVSAITRPSFRPQRRRRPPPPPPSPQRPPLRPPASPSRPGPPTATLFYTAAASAHGFSGWGRGRGGRGRPKRFQRLQRSRWQQGRQQGRQHRSRTRR